MTITHGSVSLATGNDVVTLGTSQDHAADAYVSTNAPGISIATAASRCPAVTFATRQHYTNFSGVFAALFRPLDLIGQEPTALQMSSDDDSSLTLTRGCLSQASTRHCGLCVESQYTIIGQAIS